MYSTRGGTRHLADQPRQQQVHCDHNRRLLESVQWRIFPAPSGRDTDNTSIVGETKLTQREQRCRKAGRGKRQPTYVRYEYKAGDHVLVLNSKHTRKKNLHSGGTTSDPTRNQSSLQGVVIEVEPVMTSPPPPLSSPSAQNDDIGDNYTKAASGRYCYPSVRVQVPSLSSSSLPTSSIPSNESIGKNHGDDGILTFDFKEQQRLLQPNFCASTATSIGMSKDINNLPLVPPQMTVVMVKETIHFRQLVHQLQSTDRVLEIGCSTGELSKRIVPLVYSWVGLDNSQEMVDRCTEEVSLNSKSDEEMPDDGRSQDPNLDCVDCNTADHQPRRHRRIKVVKVDALVEPQKAFHEATTPFGPPTVVFIDIGGNRQYLPVLQILSWVFENFNATVSTAFQKASLDPSEGLEPSWSSIRLVMIKSRASVEAIQRSCMDSESSFHIDPRTGIATNGTAWFLTACQEQLQHNLEQSLERMTIPRYKHPLKAPLVLSPNDEATPICRYHNYHRNGCKLRKKPKGIQSDNDIDDGYDTFCALDHEHCHACREVGHIAMDCINLKFVSTKDDGTRLPMQ